MWRPRKRFRAMSHGVEWIFWASGGKTWMFTLERAHSMEGHSVMHNFAYKFYES